MKLEKSCGYMKKFLKQNWIVCLIFALFLGLFGWRFSLFQQNFDKQYKQALQYKEDCKNLEVKMTEEEVKRCEYYGTKEIRKLDFYDSYEEMLLAHSDLFFPGILFLALAIAVLYRLSRNKEQDEVQIIRTGYKYLWIIPCMIVIMFGACYLYGGWFDFSFSMGMWAPYLVQRPWLFILSYLCNVLLLSILYLNLIFIAYFKMHDFWKSLLCCFFLFVGLVLISDVLLPFVLPFFDSYAYSIANVFLFCNPWNILGMLLWIGFTFLILKKMERKF